MRRGGGQTHGRIRRRGGWSLKISLRIKSQLALCSLYFSLKRRFMYTYLRFPSKPLSKIVLKYGKTNEKPNLKWTNRMNLSRVNLRARRKFATVAEKNIWFRGDFKTRN